MKKPLRWILNSLSVSLASALLAGLSTGCAGKPSAANIQLRKENQSLKSQLDAEKKQRAGDVAQLAAIRNNGPTIATLPPDRLARLATVTGIRIGRLTGGYSDNGPDAGVKVYFVPFDVSGEALKATGSVVIDVFDLGANGKESIRVAHADYTLEEARKAWRGEFLLDYYYVFTVPWSVPPAHANLTVRVQFTDELTQLPFVQQQQITVNPPKAGTTTAPATQQSK